MWSLEWGIAGLGAGEEADHGGELLEWQAIWLSRLAQNTQPRRALGCGVDCRLSGMTVTVVFGQHPLDAGEKKAGSLLAFFQVFEYD